MIWKLLVLGGLLGAAFYVGRLSQRNRVVIRRPVSVPALLAAVAVLLIAINSTGLTAYVLSQNQTLTDQNECRADLAAPVNDASAKATVGLARGLVLLSDDPSVHRQLVARFGPDLPAALRSQAKTILDASDDLEAANKDRSPDPVARCK